MSKGVEVETSERHGRRYASTGSPWEPIVGYSRAVRTGQTITVTGTVGLGPDRKFAAGAAGAAAQARRALEIIQAAIEALGGKLTDVVRTRIFITDISQWEAVGRVHGEVFGAIRPATTMVQVAKLIDDAALVEIEADAIVLHGAGSL
ncbi:MAG TPA: RidA family protein [Myxococcota bacterium]|nr:RidA family protein [Myxococcota bacterium]